MSEAVMDWSASPESIMNAYDSIIYNAQDDSIRKKWELMKALRDVIRQCDAIRCHLIDGDRFDADMVEHYIQYFGNIRKLTECFTTNWPLTERGETHERETIPEVANGLESVGH